MPKLNKVRTVSSADTISGQPKVSPPDLQTFTRSAQLVSRHEHFQFESCLCEIEAVQDVCNEHEVRLAQAVMQGRG